MRLRAPGPHRTDIFKLGKTLTFLFYQDIMCRSLIEIYLFVSFIQFYPVSSSFIQFYPVYNDPDHGRAGVLGIRLDLGALGNCRGFEVLRDLDRWRLS